MSNYTRNPKGMGGSKFICAQDEEDCEQELLVKQWLEREGRSGEVEFMHITGKGTARNTLVRASVRLDNQIFDDSTRTYADVISGSDGRDLHDRDDLIELEIARDSEEGLAKTILEQIIGCAKCPEARVWAMEEYLRWVDENVR